MRNAIFHVRFFFASCILLCTLLAAQAQKPLDSAVPDFSYTFAQNAGTNASAVVWVPGKQLYVTVIAGNPAYPLEGFTPNGKNVFAVEAGLDARGMWYNPATGNLEVNCAGEIGWKSFSVPDGNQPSTLTDLFTGQYQPNFQAVGAYDAAKKMVVFFDSETNNLVMYSRKEPEQIKKLPLEMETVSSENLNQYSVGYTGRKGFEFVLLDFENAKVHFFNRKGKRTATSSLPNDAPVNEAFAFAFANDRLFLYDKDERTWYAYKIF